AGAHSIPLLQKSALKQRQHLRRFPITRQFLTSTNPHIIKQHPPKLYTKHPQPNPPITLPHLHTPYINPKQTLLFAPYANIPPKF
ncbi:malate:quinone oxidoreductase, partial [Staphylococcus epidermidis]|uniref:malate:quinone oxidoreductase n=1 Tax=Staphylococcus epidermidis TaxID=1282 RepID=UPI0016426AE7